MVLPVVALVVMMVAEGNETVLRVSYVLFGISGLLFVAGFMGDKRERDARHPPTE
jgi:hypothetical protein